MYRFVILLFLLASCAIDRSTEWRTLDLKAFKIELAPGWKYVPVQGIDSYVGEFTNGMDTLFFDYGWYSPDVGNEEGDNQLYSTDTVNGKLAIITIPRLGVNGSVGMSITNLEDKRDGFFIGGSDIIISDDILRMFKSVAFPDSDTSLNPELLISKFEEMEFKDGKALFQANCASCHHPTRILTGPALKDILNQHDIDWIYKYVTDKSNRIKQKEKPNVECTEFTYLTKEEVEAIFNFTSGCGGFLMKKKE